MAAACALRAADIAWQAGRPDLATELYSLVVRRLQEPAYAFYVGEARAGIALVGDRRQAKSGAVLTSLR